MANVTQAPFAWTSQGLESLRKALGEPTAFDDFNALYDHIDDISATRQVAKDTGRPTEVRLHEPGDIVTMEDGRRYEVQDDGKWIRI